MRDVPSPQVNMKLVVALALAPVASALVAPSAPAASKTVMADAKSDLVDLQNSIPGPPGFYDPLGLSDMSFALGMQGNAVRRGVPKHRDAIEQAPRRWRGGRRGDAARTHRKILISTQVLCFRRACHQNYSNFTSFFLGVIL